MNLHCGHSVKARPLTHAGWIAGETLPEHGLDSVSNPSAAVRGFSLGGQCRTPLERRFLTGKLGAEHRLTCKSSCRSSVCTERLGKFLGLAGPPKSEQIRPAIYCPLGTEQVLHLSIGSKGGASYLGPDIF